MATFHHLLSLLEWQHIIITFFYPFWNGKSSSFFILSGTAACHLPLFALSKKPFPGLGWVAFSKALIHYAFKKFFIAANIATGNDSLLRMAAHHLLLFGRNHLLYLFRQHFPCYHPPYYQQNAAYRCYHVCYRQNTLHQQSLQ